MDPFPTYPIIIFPLYFTASLRQSGIICTNLFTHLCALHFHNFRLICLIRRHFLHCPQFSKGRFLQGDKGKASNYAKISVFCLSHFQRLFKRLFFVFSSTLWTFATCLPYRLFYLGILLWGGPPSPLLHSVVDVAYMLLVIGIVTNPLITIITQRIYRQWIAAYFWRLKSTIEI